MTAAGPWSGDYVVVVLYERVRRERLLKAVMFIVSVGRWSVSRLYLNHRVYMYIVFEGYWV